MRSDGSAGAYRKNCAKPQLRQCRIAVKCFSWPPRNRGRRAEVDREYAAFGIVTAAGAALYGTVGAARGVEDAVFIIGGGIFIGGILAGTAALIPQHRELIIHSSSGGCACE